MKDSGRYCQYTLSAIALFLLGTTVLQAQDTPIARTEYGYPDLQGYWTNPFQTPLERPVFLGEKRSYTVAEAQALIERAIAMDMERQAPLDPDRSAPEAGGRVNNQADGNFEVMPTELAEVNGEIRTSLVIDPANGRIPRRPEGDDIHLNWREQGNSRFAGPEGLTPLDRCLNPGAQLPLIYIFGGVGHEEGNPAGDNPVRNIQIMQNKAYVVMLAEYFSLVRIIRIDSEFRPETGNKWMGDSIGYYENNSLVVHTRNFRPEQSIAPLRSSEAFKVREVFTRTSDNEILFQFTITDPNNYTQPWTAEIPLQRMEDGLLLYEYACHEGNYAIPSMLRAARMEEAGLL